MAIATDTPTNGDLTGITIPVPSFVEQGKQFTVGMKDASWFDEFVSALATYVMPTLKNYVALAMSGLDTLLAIGVEFFTAAQSNDSPGFNHLVAAILGDLLGFEISDAAIQEAQHTRGRIGAMQTVGGQLFDMLASEFNPGTQVTPETGINGAKAFLGFLLSFAVREGNIETFCSLIPEEIRVFDGLRTYGELMAKNIGLGRLARRALTPLVQVLISDPLTWHLNDQYRPTLLGLSQLFKLHARALVSDQTFQQELGYLGLNLERANALEADALTTLSVSQLSTLARWGVLPPDTLETRLRALAYAPGDSAIIRRYMEVADADSDVQAMKTVLKNQRLANDISAVEFRDLVSDLPLLDEEKSRFITTVGQMLEKPRAHLTLAEVQTAYVQGILDVTELDKWLDDQGYSDDDHTTLFYLTLLKLDNLEARKKAAQFKYDQVIAKATAKGLPVPPPPAILAS